MRWSTMHFSQLPYMRKSISPDPRLVYMPLNMCICMRTFPHACRSCEDSVSSPECFTCLKKRLDRRWSTMNFSQLTHMRTSISPDPRLVYIPLNMSICMRTFPHACRSCDGSVSTPECFTCLKKRLDLRWSTMNFCQLTHMRKSISPDPRLVYIPLNMSICMRTFPHACRSCDGSVSTPECFTCLKKRLDLRWSTMNFFQLPHMRTSISPDPRLVYIPLNMSICMRTFPHACRSCEGSVSTPECFSCLKKRLDLRWSTMNFSQLPHMRTSISPDPAPNAALLPIHLRWHHIEWLSLTLPHSTSAVVGPSPSPWSCWMLCHGLRPMYSHGYSTRNSYLPKLPKIRTDWGKRITSYKCTIDWSSLPDVLKRPMPCDIFKQKIKNFLTAKYF